MTNHRPNPAVRRAARVLAITPALLVTTATGAAFAEAPEQWESGGGVAPWHALLIFVVAPLGLFLLITLLVYLPSMMRSEAYRPGQPWRGEAEWFGGPRDGLEAVDRSEPAAVGTGTSQGIPDDRRGGSSGRW